jgi:hypothetical protein
MLLVTACAAPPREQPPPAAPPEPAPPAAGRERGPAERWEVAASSLAVRVYRDGPMQKLGHNHLVTSDAIAGVIELREPVTQSGFSLELPVESLVVDDDAARAAAGPEFAAPVPQKDRDATRRNMLGEKLLDAARQGVIRLSADSIAGEGGNYEARVRVAVAGREQVVVAPFRVSVEGGELRARAAFRLTHGDLGLEPFNVALGALKVRDDFDVELSLTARRGS